jgi:hypothetical protein
VAAVQQQVVNQQQQRIVSSSSIILINGITTISNPSRQQIQTTISSLSLTLNDELINQTNILKHNQTDNRSKTRLVITIIICSLMCCMTIVGNLIVILTVCLVRKLQTASNILIVSLAVSDIFVGLFIMPLAMGKFIVIIYIYIYLFVFIFSA